MDIYDLPLLVFWILVLLFLWGVINASLYWLNPENRGRNFLISFKIELVWLFLSLTTMIIAAVNRFDTSNDFAFIISIIVCIFACVFSAAWILYKSANFDGSKSIFQTTEKKSIWLFVKTSAITFVFTIVAVFIVAGVIGLVASVFEKRSPKSSVEFGLYDI
jgi:hypothetical protein